MILLKHNVKTYLWTSLVNISGPIVCFHITASRGMHWLAQEHPCILTTLSVVIHIASLTWNRFAYDVIYVFGSQFSRKIIIITDACCLKHICLIIAHGACCNVLIHMIHIYIYTHGELFLLHIVYVFILFTFTNFTCIIKSWSSNKSKIYIFPSSSFLIPPPPASI